MGEGRELRCACAGVAALVLALFATSPAAGSVTIGQIGTPKGTGCGFQQDWVQPTVSSGSPYVVPNSDGDTSWTVTSWSGFATGPSQLTMKFFRKVGDPATYKAVAHDGPRVLTAGGAAANTFSPGGLVVQAGDVLGFFTDTTSSCEAVSTDSFLLSGAGGPSGLQDGQSGDFSPVTSARLQIEASLTPTSAFSVAGITRNKKRGNATLSLDLPNPGDIILSGPGVAMVRSADAVASKAYPAGLVKLPVRAKLQKKRKLNQTGKVKVRVTIDYTPAGGNTATQNLKVKLLKR